MDIKSLLEIGPWDWPENTDEILLAVLNDRQADKDDRDLAASMAGNPVVINDELTDALMQILSDNAEEETLRATAAIALGPALEEMETLIDDVPPFEEAPLSEQTFRDTQKKLHTLFHDATLPKIVRRRILEVSVRARQDWHADAVRAAYVSQDEDWKITAVFCMQYVQGFQKETLEALESNSPDLYFEAIRAAGANALEEVWAHVEKILTTKKSDADLVMVAIEAAGCIHPEEARTLILPFLDSDDEDISDVAHETLVLIDEPWDEEDFNLS